MLPDTTPLTPPNGGGLYIVWLDPEHLHFYGGRTKGYTVRWRTHLSRLRTGKHCNRHMQAVYNKHKYFEPEEVEHPAGPGLKAAEQAWLDAHYGKPGCVNVCDSADGGVHAHSPETRALLSQSLKGREFTPEHKAALVVSSTGRKMDPALAPKWAKRNQDRVWTEESRARMAASQLGRKHSAETRAKMALTKGLRDFERELEAL